MKSITLHGLLFLLIAAGHAADRKPNIVFVLADDLGWAELGCYGNRFHETPNLDRMARDGMRFTQAYAAAPVCSPYRAALLTGLHPARLGILDYLRPNSANRLPAHLQTLPERLKALGYATGMIGKWHLTGYRYHGAEFETRPTDHGFDWNIGSEVKGVGNGANTWPYVFRDQPVRWIDLPEPRLGPKENLTDRLNLEAVEFIERNRDQPFFLYLAHYAPHTILNGRPDLVEKYRRKHPPGKSGRANCYLCEDAGLGKGDPLNHWAVDHNPHLAAMIEGIDDGIGRIRARLAELGLLENTIFIFTSDNGGESNVTSNAPLRGGKSELYEGGIRVPLIVQWPARIRPGTVNKAPIMNTGFLSLLTRAATEPGLDPFTDREPPAALCWHYPLDRPHFLGGFSGGAIRVGEWKLIERFADEKIELYHLAGDPSERIDLASREPDRAQKMRDQLERWRRSVDARIPSPPLLTEPTRLYFADHFSGPASERIHYNGDWSAEDGVLKRLDTGSENTRVFLRDAEYGEALIRFDFQLGRSRDIRMITGSHGHYNAVVHIRPDHFFIQTAKDESGPYFSYRHGECAFAFDPKRWYTMTVEIIGDQMVAHVDHNHVAYATHPILRKDRTYFAFQVDDRPAAFDNVQIFQVRPHRDQAANLAHIRSVSDRHPVPKSPEEEYRIRKSNAHEWLYQRHPEYRALVRKVDEYDALKKKRFPAAFRSHKEMKKQALALRRRLNQEDPRYKELLHATHRANRALDAWLLEQRPEIANLPDSRRKAALERARRELRDTEGYRRLVEVATRAQQALEAAYPEAFITDEQINARRRVATEKLKADPEYRRLQEARAAAYRAQQEYLHTHDARLGELKRILDSRK